MIRMLKEEGTQFWCIVGNHACPRENSTMIMETAFKLTKEGPIQFGMCKECCNEESSILRVNKQSSSYLQLT